MPLKLTKFSKNEKNKSALLVRFLWTCKQRMINCRRYDLVPTCEGCVRCCNVKSVIALRRRDGWAWLPSVRRARASTRPGGSSRCPWAMRARTDSINERGGQLTLAMCTSHSILIIVSVCGCRLHNKITYSSICSNL